MACTEADWQRGLAGAVGAHALAQNAPGGAEIAVGAGRLSLQWTQLPERQIALARVPRMAVSYRFEEVDAAARSEFMRYFDLYMMRGGG